MATINTQNESVKYQRREYTNLLPQYWLISDVLEGETAIKGLTGSPNIPVTVLSRDEPLYSNIIMTRARRYLPMPNAEDQTPQNQERYRAYVTRAVFYNVAGRTVEGMKGQVFLRDPVVELPAELEVMKTDADGSGLSLDQVAGNCVWNVLGYGRAGILVDYPFTPGPTTAAQKAAGNIHPIFKVYSALQIINWRTKMQGAKKILTLVVICEYVDEQATQGFAPTTYERYRVLRLDDNGNYTVELWEPDQADARTLAKGLVTTPTDSKGQPFKEIPFHFVGPDNNDVDPNKPPIYDMAVLNIAHYRNSADYEEACYFVGQPTVALAGLTEDWVNNVLKGKMTLGSRANIPLPVGAKAELLQVNPNTLPKEAMDAKEAQMIALGARLVKAQPKKSATAKIIDESSENSILSNIARNCSAAFVWALGMAARFAGADATKITYDLNDDFDLNSVTSDDLNATLLSWQSALISYEEARAAYRKAGIAILSDEDARIASQKDITDGMIPDPKLANKQPAQNAPKGASNAGGPQPGASRQPPNTAGSR